MLETTEESTWFEPDSAPLNEKLKSILKGFGIKQLELYKCDFKFNDGTHAVIILIFVDDTVILCLDLSGSMGERKVEKLNHVSRLWGS